MGLLLSSPNDALYIADGALPKVSSFNEVCTMSARESRAKTAPNTVKIFIAEKAAAVKDSISRAVSTPRFERSKVSKLFRFSRRKFCFQVITFIFKIF